MRRRLLVAVDDSPDSLAAAQLAIALAQELAARLRVVHVLVDHELSAALTEVTGVRHEVGTGDGPRSVLSRVAALAEVAGVAVETALLEGPVAATVLSDARTWSADLIVLGRSRRPSSGQPYVGAQTRHVLEFAERPVLVVPRPSPPGHFRGS